MKEYKNFMMDRRRFIKNTALGLSFFSSFGLNSLIGKESGRKAKIALIKTNDRVKGVQEVLRLLEFAPVKNKRVFIKPNFNTADPPPASTHNDTLGQLIGEIKDRGAADITVGERSGPPETKKVLEDKGIFECAKKLDFKLVNFEKLPEKDWIHFNPKGCHWQKGFYLPRPAVEAEYLVSTCCLKTHQYGGVFTMSLKLSVGLTPKKLMRELHSSPHMRKMIAELNQPFTPQLIVMDGIDAFVDGGPMKGTLKKANVMVAGCDRVAVDAVGVAILKELGSNKDIMERKIFEQDQIKHAAQLGLGITTPQQVEFVTPDKTSSEYARKLKSILASG